MSLHPLSPRPGRYMSNGAASKLVRRLPIFPARKAKLLVTGLHKAGVLEAAKASLAAEALRSLYLMSWLIRPAALFDCVAEGRRRGYRWGSAAARPWMSPSWPLMLTTDRSEGLYGIGSRARACCWQVLMAEPPVTKYHHPDHPG